MALILTAVLNAQIRKAKKKTAALAIKGQARRRGSNKGIGVLPCRAFFISYRENLSTCPLFMAFKEQCHSLLREKKAALVQAARETAIMAGSYNR